MTSDGPDETSWREQLLSDANLCRAFSADQISYFDEEEDDPANRGTALLQGEFLRGALMHAAVVGVDYLLEELAQVRVDEKSGVATDWDQLIVLSSLPTRFRHRYDSGFVRKFLVAWIEVGHKLAQERWEYCATLAEEIALHLHKELAEVTLEMAEIDNPDGFAAFDDAAYEDMDFEQLWDPALDGFEDEPDFLGIGMTDMRFDAWFTPFNTLDRFPHPYARDKATPFQ